MVPHGRKEAVITASVPFVLNVDWIWTTAAVGAVYGLGLLRVRGTGWPRSRTLFFYAGLGAVLVAFVSPLDNYDAVSFFAHTAEHLILAFVAAPLVALGAPLTLFVRAAPPRLRDRVLRPVVESRVASVLTHPVVDWVVFIGFLLATHLPPLYDYTLRSGGFHLFVHAMYLVTGFIFWWPIVGLDPIPRRVSFPARLVYLVVAIPFGGALGLAIFFERDPLYRFYTRLPHPWGGHAALLSQHRGGLLLLVGTAVALLVAAVLVARAWLRDRRRATEAQMVEAGQG